MPATAETSLLVVAQPHQDGEEVELEKGHYGEFKSMWTVMRFSTLDRSRSPVYCE